MAYTRSSVTTTHDPARLSLTRREANKQDVFTWVGSIPPLLWGTHHFLFTPSTETPGGTTFVQREDFEGLLAVPFWPWRHSFKPSEPWARFNAGLKREAERVSGRG
ncbi:hypothetical protein BN1708_006162 [Verticillium longisporum]|uniref:Uncharacterized protein n=1 Tax=Verticillium longisporum TaxID=100787 RepID=A0A0G4MHP8_VERLO|nr:hypothetical protein BN1708_006162 [Verticillium longisporum]